VGSVKQRLKTTPLNFSERYEDGALSEGNLNGLQTKTMKKVVLNDFMMACKMKELDKLVDQKSYYQETIPDDDQYIDIYLDNDQRRILEVTKCLIRGHSTWKMRWDLVIMIMAVFN
jgi:hypothetical protein